jgi:hypothetical protein
MILYEEAIVTYSASNVTVSLTMIWAFLPCGVYADMTATREQSRKSPRRCYVRVMSDEVIYTKRKPT